LYEQVVYVADGNPLTAIIMDYEVVSEAEMISFETHHTVTPTPLTVSTSPSECSFSSAGRGRASVPARTVDVCSSGGSATR
jgi:hypothetical protein